MEQALQQEDVAADEAQQQEPASMEFLTGMQQALLEAAYRVNTNLRMREQLDPLDLELLQAAHRVKSTTRDHQQPCGQAERQLVFQIFTKERDLEGVWKTNCCSACSHGDSVVSDPPPSPPIHVQLKALAQRTAQVEELRETCELAKAETSELRVQLADARNRLDTLPSERNTRKQHKAEIEKVCLQLQQAEAELQELPSVAVHQQQEEEMQKLRSEFEQACQLLQQADAELEELPSLAVHQQQQEEMQRLRSQLGQALADVGLERELKVSSATEAERLQSEVEKWHVQLEGCEGKLAAVVQELGDARGELELLPSVERYKLERIELAELRAQLVEAPNELGTLPSETNTSKQHQAEFEKVCLQLQQAEAALQELPSVAVYQQQQEEMQKLRSEVEQALGNVSTLPSERTRRKRYQAEIEKVCLQLQQADAKRCELLAVHQQQQEEMQRLRSELGQALADVGLERELKVSSATEAQRLQSEVEKWHVQLEGSEGKLAAVVQELGDARSELEFLPSVAKVKQHKAEFEKVCLQLQQAEAECCELLAVHQQQQEEMQRLRSQLGQALADVGLERELKVSSATEAKRLQSEVEKWHVQLEGCEGKLAAVVQDLTMYQEQEQEMQRLRTELAECRHQLASAPVASLPAAPIMQLAQQQVGARVQRAPSLPTSGHKWDCAVLRGKLVVALHQLYEECMTHLEAALVKVEYCESRLVAAAAVNSELQRAQIQLDLVSSDEAWDRTKSEVHHLRGRLMAFALSLVVAVPSTHTQGTDPSTTQEARHQQQSTDAVLITELTVAMQSHVEQALQRSPAEPQQSYSPAARRRSWAEIIPTWARDKIISPPASPPRIGGEVESEVSDY